MFSEPLPISTRYGVKFVVRHDRTCIQPNSGAPVFLWVVVFVFHLTLFSTVILLFVSLVLWLSSLASLASSLVASNGGCHTHNALRTTSQPLLLIFEAKKTTTTTTVSETSTSLTTSTELIAFSFETFSFSRFFSHFAFVLVYGFRFLFFFSSVLRARSDKQSTHGCASSITKLENYPEVNVARSGWSVGAETDRIMLKSWIWLYCWSNWLFSI